VELEEENIHKMIHEYLLLELEYFQHNNIQQSFIIEYSFLQNIEYAELLQKSILEKRVEDGRYKSFVVLMKLEYCDPVKACEKIMSVLKNNHVISNPALHFLLYNDLDGFKIYISENWGSKFIDQESYE